MKYILATFIISGLFFACQNKSKTEKHSEKGNHHMQHKCTHCGMPSNEFPKWQTKILTDAGEKRTCSPRCMFFSVLEKEVSNIQSIKVKEYYEQKEIDAQTAFYVTGSNIIGPMGKGFVPFVTKADAEEFMKDHKGKAILKFEQVSLKTIQEIVKN